ncbi:hypothetical protein [Streptomyces sp. NPDC059918]|uniref:hypothetical protein n=1 Tax=unclassified Streptomyces TaxID=2593676 RepID=UPI0036695520
MPQDCETRNTATLYGSAHYQGTAVTVVADRWDQGEDATAYSLAYLGLGRLCSLRAPTGPSDPHDPFRQHGTGITHVTVWESRPDTWPLNPRNRGTTWQQFSADTGDLGAWARRSRYVRVWHQQDGAAMDAELSASCGPTRPITVVE